MKGIMSVIEVMITGIILIMAFLHFFPQYSVRTEWDRVLLATEVMDTLNTIDRLDKTYDFAACPTEFDDFMKNTFTPGTSGAMIWWKETEDLEGYTEDMHIPYFTQGYKESMVDVELISDYFADASTVGMWHFNESTGCFADEETINDYDGSLEPSCPGNNPQWVCGKSGNALYFDGNDDYVDVSSMSMVENGDFTIEAWIKGNNDQKDENIYIVGFPSNFGFRVARDVGASSVPDLGMWCRLQPGCGAADEIGHNTGMNVLDGKWHHIAVTKTGRDFRFYVDGNLVEPPYTLAADLCANPASRYIGSGSPTYGNFKGLIDEVRISGVARSSFDIRYDVYSFTLGLGYPY